MENYSKHPPRNHVCVAILVRARAGDAFTLCSYGHLVEAKSALSPLAWDEHLRQLHERTLTGRVGEPEPTTTQEDE